MSCCYGNRFAGGGAGVNPSRQRAGIYGYISHYGENDNRIATTVPAWSKNVLTSDDFVEVSRAVRAGVAIWAVTKVLDGILSWGKKR